MYNAYSNGAEFQQPVSLRSFLTVVFKRKWIILSVFISVAATVTVGSFLLPLVFKASSKVLMEREIDSEKALLFQMNFPVGYEKYNWVNSEVEIVKSYPVAVCVVKALQLDQLGQKEKPVSETERVERFEKAVKKFQKKLKVENAKNSNVIEVSYETNDPRLAAAVVNKVVEAYINCRSEIYDESETYKFFEKQMRLADEKLRRLEQRQAAFKQRNEVVSPQAQVDILLTKLADYERSLTAVRMKRIGKEAKLAVISEELQKGEEISIPSTEASDSPSREKHIAKLKGELLDMEIQRERLLQKFTPQYEEVVNLDNQIAATRAKVENEIRQIVDMEKTAIRALKAEEKVLQASVDKITKGIKGFAQKEYELSQLSRGIDDNREVYSMLLKQREEARISLAKLERGVKIKVINPAVIPTDPIKPRKKLNVALAVFLGLVSGLGLAFLVEYFDHSVNTTAELEQFAGLTVLGSVREIKNGGPNAQGESKENKIAKATFYEEFAED